MSDNYILQQIAERERLYKSRNRLSWIFTWSTVVAIIAIPLLCGLANCSTSASYTISILSFFGFGILGIVFQSIAKRHKKEIQRLQAQQQQLDIRDNIAPIIETSCKHCSGLPISGNTLCRLTIFQDMVYFNSGTMEFKIPMERVRSIDVLTQEQTEYVSTSNMGRVILSGLLFGELGMLISAERAVDDRERTITVKNLVITYEKDGEAKFIVLNDLPCDEVEREIKKYIAMTPRAVEL